MQCYVYLWGIKSKVLLNLPPDIRHPEELSLLRKPRDPKKKKKKLEEAEEEDQELEGPLLTPGSGEFVATESNKNIGLWMPRAFPTQKGWAHANWSLCFKFLCSKSTLT